jgi:CHAT domain-containing protein
MRPQTGAKSTKWVLKLNTLKAHFVLFVPFCGYFLLIASSVYAQSTAEADKLRAEQREDSNFKAIEKYREEHTAIALRNAGEILQLLGNTSEALASYTEALALAKKTRNSLEAGKILNDLAYLHFIGGNTDEVLKNARAALRIGKNLHDRELEARAISNLGEAFYNLGNLEKASEHQQQSLAIWRELNNPRGQALASIALGYNYKNLGQPEEAQRVYAEALSLARQSGDLAVETLALIAVGNINRKIGNNQQALESYAAAKPITERIGDQTSRARILGGMGSIYFEMGDARQALEHMGEGTKLMERLGKTWGIAEGKLSLGRIHRSLGNDDKALQYLDEALVLFRLLRMPRLESATLREIGLVNETRGNLVKALESYKAALNLTKPAEDQREYAYTLAYAGRIHEQLKEFGRALKCYHEALLLSQHSGDPVGEALVRFNLAHLERSRGNLAEAKREAEATLSIVESQRASVASQDLRTTYFATVRNTYDLYINILMQLHKQDPEAAGFDRQAFAVSEKARARSFLELLSEARSLATPSLSLQDVQQRLLDNDTALVEYALGDDQSYVWLVTRTSFESYELGPRADIETSARRLYASVASRQMIYGESTNARAAREAKADADIPADTAALSKLILGPLAGKLQKKKLLFVADGALQYIPFALLHDPDSTNLLIAGHEIINAPSASTLALLQQEAAKRKPAANAVAVLADPVFESDDPRITRDSNRVNEMKPATEVRQALRDAGISPEGVQIPRLFASANEADGIMAVAPWGSALKAVGFGANRERVMGSELSDYRIIHFATHGIINNERPELSGIVLSLFDSEGHSQNGFLRLRDIYNLHLPADLVVLSACSTGLGKEVRGEGLIGLTRGFIYAGASGVIASLWKVDDDATAELMTHFYEALFKKGMSPPAALRSAQLALSQNKRWQSPYYWAGFVIQGQYSETQKFTEPFPGKIHLVLLGIAGFFALILMLGISSGVLKTTKKHN